MVERESPTSVRLHAAADHREIAVAALERGIHVYLEKPIARGLDDARAIVDAAVAPEAVCAVGYQWRGVEALDALREALEGQEIGLLIGIATGPTKSRPWFLDRAQGGGNLLERASHQIDLERAVGGEVVAVQAAASPRSAGAERRRRPGRHRGCGGAGPALRERRHRRGPDRLDPRRAARAATRSTCSASDSSLHLELDPAFTLSGRSPAAQTSRRRGAPHPRTARSSASSGRARRRPGCRLLHAGRCGGHARGGARLRGGRSRAARTVDGAALVRSRHTDHVGSLLRSRELLDARAARAAGELEPAAFKRVEDGRSARRSPSRSRPACEVVTDGELRRESFQSELTAAVEGVEGVGIDAWLWGDWHSGTAGDRAVGRPAGSGRDGAAAPAALPRQRGVHVPACRHHPHGQDHAAEPDAVRQPLGPGALARRLPALRRLHGRRRRDARRRGARARAPRLHLRPARRTALPAADRSAAGGASTRTGAGRWSAGSHMASSSTTRSSRPPRG